MKPLDAILPNNVSFLTSFGVDSGEVKGQKDYFMDYANASYRVPTPVIGHC